MAVHKCALSVYVGAIGVMPRSRMKAGDVALGSLIVKVKPCDVHQSSPGKGSTDLPVVSWLQQHAVWIYGIGRCEHSRGWLKVS